MTSAASAVEAAVYTALTAGLTLATVYQHAPENAALPVVIIGDIEAEPFDTKDEADGLLSCRWQPSCRARRASPLSRSWKK
jgi:hypothetical protein